MARSPLESPEANASRLSGQQSSRWMKHVLLAVGALFFLTSAIQAAALRAEVTPVGGRHRSQAPMLVDVTLHWSGSGLLEGRLESTFSSLDGPIFHLNAADLVLVAGAKTVRVMTPPLPVHFHELEAKLRFVTRKESIPLGSFRLTGPMISKRNFVIAVCSSGLKSATSSPGLLEALLIERFQEGAKTPTERVTTSPTRLEPEDLPANALGFCAFDLVLLEGRSFTALREKQLAALAVWVEAGGSLCVISSEPIPPEHLAWLNRLASTRNNLAPFTVDDSGHLKSEAAKLIFSRAGLGRLVVATEFPPDETALATAEWRRANAFLWKFRHGIASAISSGGRWNIPEEPRSNAQPRQTKRGGVLQSFFGARLFPESARLIPIQVIAGILALFVLAVGPGEWFVLGWLRRRRWTWITFPLFAVLFTLTTVQTAQHYLGAGDHRRSLTLIDLGPNGPVRETEIEMLFTARDKTVSTDLRHRLGTPTTLAQRYYNGTSETGDQTPTFDGLLPVASQLRQPVRQWTPRINRTLTFNVAPDESGLAWDTITEGDLKTDLRDWIGRQNGSGRFEFFLTTGRVLGRAVRGSISTDVSRQVEQRIRTRTHPNETPVNLTLDFCWALSQIPEFAVTSVLSQISPSADAELEDLALTDPSDPHDWAVFALETLPSGNLRLYRRAYRTDE
ncbi:MAG TPA: hypothetical protein VF593_04035 [Chthoniobacteraceae bacterium]|jgi:hypothetical protein